MERTKEEIELLNACNIENFRQLKASHAMELFSTLKEYSQETQIKILEQIPNLTDFFKESLSLVKSEIDSLLLQNNLEINDCYETCNSIVLTLQKILDSNETLSYEQQMEIVDKMQQINEFKYNIHKNEQNYRSTVLESFIKITGGIAFGLICGVLGVKFGSNHKNIDGDDN